MKQRSLLYVFLLIALIVTSPAAAQDAADMIARVNELRVSLGLAPYSWNASLAAAANTQAAYLASSGIVSHTGADGSSPRDRARAAGYASPWVSENIYVGGIAGIGDAMTFWVNSPVHYASLTSPNYTDIGGAIAVGSTRSFVLVFGAPDTRPIAGASGGGNSGSSSANSANNAASAPPVFVVGVDAQGNIMHEIQPGDTLGDIALLYGYSWDDIPAMLTLNGMTQDDIRELPIGGIFLVPPWDGTYTPSPAPEDFTPSATHTPEATATSTATPTPPATLTPTASSTSIVVAALNQPPLPLPATYIAPTTAAPPQLIAHPLDSMATPPPVIETVGEMPETPSSGLPGVIIGVVVVQAGIFLAAAYEFFRRRS